LRGANDRDDRNRRPRARPVGSLRLARRAVLVLGLGRGLASLPTPADAAASGKAAAGKSGVAEKGSVELGLAGLVDLNPGTSTAAYLEVTLGYFLLQGLEAGVQTVQGTTRTGQRDIFGVFGEYDFTNATRFLPFAGLEGQHQAPPTDTAEKDIRTGVVYGGAKVLLSPDTALSLTLKAEFADRAVYGLPGDRRRNNHELNMGLKFFF
jgi:hypothetical protein